MRRDQCRSLCQCFMDTELFSHNRWDLVASSITLKDSILYPLLFPFSKTSLNHEATAYPQSFGFLHLRTFTPDLPHTGQFKSLCSMTALITYHTPSFCFPLPPTISFSFQFSFVPIHFYSPWPNQSHCVSRADCPLCVNAASNNPLLRVFVYVCESVLGKDSSEMGFWTSPLSLQNRQWQIF